MEKQAPKKTLRKPLLPKENEGLPGVVEPEISFKASLYLKNRIEHPEWTKERCKNEAGYCKGTKPEIIDKMIAQAITDIPDMAERIRTAQRETGFNAASNLSTLQEIRERGDYRERIAAIKVGTEITGERMPEQIGLQVSGDESVLSRLFVTK
jgi:hypothetical protein